MLEWVEELKSSELMNNQFNFSPAYLQRTLWKMMIKVDRLYSQECTLETFERRGGANHVANPNKVVFYPFKKFWMGTR